MKTLKHYFKGIVLIGIRDAVEILGISRDYMYELIRKKRIPYQKTSSGYIFPLDAVNDFQFERTQKAKTDPRIRLK